MTDFEGVDNQTQDNEMLAVQLDIPPLPMVLDKSGQSVVDWGGFLPEAATVESAASLIKHEINYLSSMDAKDLDARQRRERILRGADFLLDRVNHGSLKTNSEVASAMDFIADMNPSLTRVGDLMDEGRSIEQVTGMYTQREALDVSLLTAEKLCQKFGIEADDDDMLDLLDTCIEKIIEKYKLDYRYRDIAAKKLLELAESGLTLADIAE